MNLVKLTNSQIKLTDVVKNEWLSLLFSGTTKIDKEKIKEGVKWLYSFSNLKEPLIVITDSPLGAQCAVNMLKGQISTKEVWNQVGNQVWNQVRNQVRNQVGNEVLNQVWNQVRNQVRNQVGNQVGNEVLNQVWNQ